jgi:hypothetical protein
MFRFRSLIASGFCGIAWAMAIAQENATPLPEIWKEIEPEAEAISKLEPPTTYHTSRAWEAADRLTKSRNRSTIHTLFESVSELDRLPVRDEREYLTDWMKRLAAYVIIETADPKGRYGLKPIVRRWGMRADLKTMAVVGVDCYHDDSSRDWLFMVVSYSVDDPGDGRARFDASFFFALQLLRGYQPDKAMRQKLHLSLQEESTSTDRVARDVRAHVRSVLSSWDFADSLQDPAIRRRYRDFQSRLWRFWAIGPKGFRGVGTEYHFVAAHLLKDWHPGDERFVIRIFENPASMRDESKIAVYLAHKLPDAAPLKEIADSDSPQAPYAREALQIIDRQ